MKTGWEFSYFVDMTNRTHEEREYTVTVHFVDADGFSVFADRYAGDVLNKIPAKSTKRLLARAATESSVTKREKADGSKDLSHCTHSLDKVRRRSCFLLFNV